MLYQILGANKSGDDISRSIINKLRNTAKSELPTDKGLTPKQVVHLLEQHHRLREIVGEQQYRLLKQALTQQFIIIIVYVLSVGFCSWTVYLFVQAPIVQKKAEAASGAINQRQSSTGKNAPNVISSGSAPITVTIQDQAAPTPTPLKPRERK